MDMYYDDSENFAEVLVNHGLEPDCFDDMLEMKDLDLVSLNQDFIQRIFEIKMAYENQDDDEDEELSWLN